MKQNAYDALAEWFEYLNDDCGYEEWSQYLLSLLKKHAAGKTAIDIGCGSGYFSRKLYRAGYKVIGLDCNQAMLSKAQQLSLEEGCDIQFLLGDITKFKSPNRFEVATAVNDCFNYIPKNKLLTALKKVNGALKKDGLFFFDISAANKLNNLPPVSIDDREDVTYFSFNRMEEGCVVMDVTLFVKNGGMSTYKRYDEQHTQYVYSQEEIENALTAAGFELIFCSGHLGTEKEKAERLEFLARRK